MTKGQLDIIELSIAFWAFLILAAVHEGIYKLLFMIIAVLVHLFKEYVQKKVWKMNL
jgi:hypothetical protein